MKHLLYILLLLIATTSAMAQSHSATLQQRYDYVMLLYSNGQFAECQELASGIVKESSGRLKTSAYRILALCCLAKDDIPGARDYIDLLLKEDPYFTPSLGDPQRFIDLIDENKSQEAGITTASRQAETIDEAPVPVTLITEEMIQYSGVTTLQELLCLYVPGMTLAEGCETNVAMHGIYSFMQDKILIMVDGHRLNSFSTNAEAPDYRTSLDKVKQIEVLRGPASSLYGNVALTAVVNIITRKGAQFGSGGGGRLSAMVGTQETYGSSLIVGGGNNVVDIMGWGSVFYSKGFEHQMQNERGGITTLYSNGFRGRPSYDIGIKGRWKDFTMSINMQRSKRVPYYNIVQVPATQSTKQLDLLNKDYSAFKNYNAVSNYNYDDYLTINGDEPGVSRTNDRINLDYTHSFNKFEIQAQGYVNFENTSIYNVLADSISRNDVNPTLSAIFPELPYQSSTASLLTHILGEVDDLGNDAQYFKYYMQRSLASYNAVPNKKVYEYITWKGLTFGLQAQGLLNYNLLGHGSLILGMQYENFFLTSNSFTFPAMEISTAITYTSFSIFKNGSENSLSGYTQLKHTFPHEKIIINAGLRFDHKDRFNNQSIDKFSPRFSIIWKLTRNLSLRGNYNYSFVDAPYLYRASILKMFGGGSEMEPETMHSFNLGTLYYDKKKHFSAELDFFYNILNDLCVMNSELLTKNETSATGTSTLKYGYMFINTGKIRSLGVDAAVQYTQPRFFANINATWQQIVTASHYYYIFNNQTYSTPELHINHTVAGAPYKGKGTGFFDGGTLWVRGTLQFQTATYYRTMDFLSAMLAQLTQQTDVYKITRVAPQCNITLGVNYNWKHIDIDLTLKNIFNNEYCIGSMLSDGIPHAGRQFIAKLTWKF